MTIQASSKRSKILYLMEFLKANTDEEHGVTVREITDYLEGIGITADRKTIYADLGELQSFGLDIVKERKAGVTRYRLVSREFEKAELKLLIDAVQVAKFISETKTKALIKKIEELASKYEGSEMHRQVSLTNRVKAQNQYVTYSVDAIHNAINQNQKLSFLYYFYNEKKEKVFRNDNKLYTVSPWELIWDDENYYLVAFDDKDHIIKHFRVDKMERVKILEEKREGATLYKEDGHADPDVRIFHMYGGDVKDVTLLCDNSMAGIILDEFGRNINLVPVDAEHFQTMVKVQLSNQFLAWVFGLDGKIRIAGPDDVIAEMKKLMDHQKKFYK